MRSLLARIAFAVSLPAILIALWQLGTSAAENFFFPTPARIVEAFVTTWTPEHFLTDAVPSLARLSVGLSASIVIGIALGIFIGSVRWIRELSEPVLELFRAIPPPVLIPLLLLLLGVGDAMKVVVIISGSVWPVLLNTIEGVRAVDGILSDTTRGYGISGWGRIRRLVIPSALPSVFAGIRQALAISLILMVVSEMFASSSGLGFSILQAQRSFRIPEMWASIALLGMLGVVLSFCFQLGEARILRWHRDSREVERGN